MPYQNEVASKSSHFDIVRNPQIAEFLDGCGYLKEPSEEEGQAMGNRWEPTPPTQGASLPDFVIAVDGSLHEDAIDPKRFPSTRFGYIKVSSVLIDLGEFGALWVDDGRYVDPFRVAKLRDGTDALTFPLPSANVTWGGKGSVRDSFRAAVDAHLSSPRTRWNEADPTTSLRTTLFRLAASRPDIGTGNPTKLKIHRCPNEDCGKGPIEVQDIPEPQYCPHCGSEVYPADCLRVWEEVQEFQPNVQAISRLMLLIEHMLPIHYIRHVREEVRRLYRNRHQLNAVSAMETVSRCVSNRSDLEGVQWLLDSELLGLLDRGLSPQWVYVIYDHPQRFATGPIDVEPSCGGVRFEVTPEPQVAVLHIEGT